MFISFHVADLFICPILRVLLVRLVQPAVKIDLSLRDIFLTGPPGSWEVCITGIMLNDLDLYVFIRSEDQ